MFLVLTGRLLQSQSFINCLDECAHLYVNSHLWSKCALQYIFLYRRKEALKDVCFVQTACENRWQECV